MADTPLHLNPGSGGADVAMKERVAASAVYAPVSLIGEAGSDNTAPVSATNGLAVDPRTLPPGAATSAAQATGNTSLANLETDIGALTETAPSTDTASSGLNGRLQRIAQRLTTVISTLGSPLQAGGQVDVTDRALRDNGKIDIAGIDVALPAGSAKIGSINIRNNADSANIDPLSESDFDTKTGSLTETAPATDTASSGLNGRLQRIAQRLTSLIALVPSALTGSGNFKAAVVEQTAAIPAGSAKIGSVNIRNNADSANIDPLSESDFDTKTGSLTETAPSTDTASSGLNGRLQRVAQRLTSLIALFPSALTGSGNFKSALVETTVQQPVGIGTDAIYSGTTSLTPKFAKISASSSGNNNLVAAVTSKKLRVLAYTFISNGTVNAKFQSDGAGTPSDLTGLKYCVVNMGIAAPFNPCGWFETASGKTLDINLSAAVAVGGELVYIEV